MYTTGPDSLWTVDLYAGAMTFVANTPPPADPRNRWRCLAADPTDGGQLYGIHGDGELLRISIDGSTTLIASDVEFQGPDPSGRRIAALAFDGVGRLWGINWSTGRLV